MKPSTIKYFFRESFSGLKKNMLMPEKHGETDSVLAWVLNLLKNYWQQLT